MIGRIVRDRARNTPNRVAIDDGVRRWTYADLDARSEELARSFRRGERVATLTANSAEHVAVFFACAKAGAILLPGGIAGLRLRRPPSRKRIEEALRPSAGAAP